MNHAMSKSGKETIQRHVKEMIKSLDIENNSYYQANNKMFNDLVKLIIEHPNQYSNMLNKKEESVSPMLFLNTDT